ncbi:MAG: TetR/AcrR family transcriptional regulator [Myxococcota bacterium]
MTGAPLGERLVQVALRLLDEQGLEALTLRNVARGTGVSHGAPARHFRSLSDLRAEVAAHGFRLLSEAMEKSGAALPPDAGPLPRLVAAARAYVDCAVANPALFALMFRTGDLDVGNAAFARDAGAAFERLLSHVRAAQAAGWHADRDARLLAGSLWASVHGLATLWSQCAFQGPVPEASLEDALTITLELAHGGQQGDLP